MRLFRWALAGSALLWFASSLCVQAQVPTNLSVILRATADRADFASGEGFTFHRKVEEAQVHFAARDRAGRPVLGLRPKDVRVFDGAVAVGELKSFALSHYQPLEIGIVVDLSASIGRQQEPETLMAIDLLAEIFDSQRDAAFLVGFAEKATLLQPATPDIGLIRTALIANHARHGLTSLYDALVQTCREEFKSENAEGRQRVILLFSDGFDTLSMHGPDDAVREAKRAGVTVYAITTSTDPDGLKNLRRLAQATSGRTYVVPKKHQLDTLISALSESVRGEYTVTFQPATTAAGFHPVRILAADPDVTLRGVNGYILDSKQ